jgi:hypothetical protein
MTQGLCKPDVARFVKWQKLCKRLLATTAAHNTHIVLVKHDEFLGLLKSLK